MRNKYTNRNIVIVAANQENFNNLLSILSRQIKIAHPFISSNSAIFLAEGWGKVVLYLDSIDFIWTDKVQYLYLDSELEVERSVNRYISLLNQENSQPVKLLDVEAIKHQLSLIMRLEEKDLERFYPNAGLT